MKNEVFPRSEAVTDIIPFTLADDNETDDPTLVPCNVMSANI